MTIGESISRLRKEKGLSQEALGYELGVTRQAVSRWENDSATPDVEKLLLMSKLFGVSPGEILGVKDEAAESLTREQEKVVEKVLDKYISALNEKYSGRSESSDGSRPDSDGRGEVPVRPKKAWRRKLPAAVVTVLFAALVLWCAQMGGSIKNIRNNYDQLRNEMNYVNIDVSSITNRVEEILAAQSSVLASVSCEPVEGDLVENTVTFKVEAVPKEQTENTMVTFTGSSGGEEVSVEGIRDGSVFRAEITVPLTDSIQVMARITTDGKSLYEQIKSVYSLYWDSLPQFSTIPSTLWGEHIDAINSDGARDTLMINELEGGESGDSIFGKPAEIKSVVFIILLNGEEIRTYPPEITENEEGLRTFIKEYTVDFTLKEGDKLDFCYDITDSYDREIHGYSGSLIVRDGMMEIVYEEPEGYSMYG